MTKCTHGGARPGAGRPKKEPVLLDVGQHDDPLDFLTAVMLHADAAMALRLDAAKALMPFQHARAGNSR